MKNIINEKPTGALSGRLLASVKFVRDSDVKGKKILDIGCGYGWCELNFLKRGVGKIVGIEISEEDLNTIKNNVKDKRTEFVIGSAIDIPFPDNTFDTIVSWEVLEHIPKHTEKKMFKEMQRVLKKGGVAYLSTPYNSFLARTLDPAYWLIGHRHYSKEQIRSYAKYAKLKIVDLYITGGTWTVFSILNFYVSKWILRRKSLFYDFFTKKVDKEFTKKTGNASVFLKLQKT